MCTYVRVYICASICVFGYTCGPFYFFNIYMYIYIYYLSVFYFEHFYPDHHGVLQGASQALADIWT